MREGRLDDARDELESMLRQNGKSFWANFMLGWVYNSQRRWTEALDCFKKAIAIDAMRAPPHLLAGFCALRLNDLEYARLSFEAALNINPKMPGAHFGMAQALQVSGDIDDALAHIQEVLRLDPLSSTARLVSASVLRKSGRVADAIQELEVLLKMNPTNFEACTFLSAMYDQQGNHRKAAQLLESAAKLKPAAVHIWRMLGRSKKEMKDYEGAEAAYREALRLRPQGGTNSLPLVDVLIAQRKYEEALELIRSTPRYGRVGGMLLKYSGDIFAAQGNFDEALQAYRAALANSGSGESMVEELEAAAQSDPDSAAKVERYQAAIGKLEDESRERMAEQDWQSMFELLQGNGSDRPGMDRFAEMQEMI
jgi:tetratricopeptide (TPR) repeat protein